MSSSLDTWLARESPLDNCSPAINCPRAARLMDTLEKQGVVGPPEQGGASRMVRLGMPATVADEEE